MSQDPSFPVPPPPAAPPLPPSGSGGDFPGSGADKKLPWEERDQLGFLNALIETAKLIVTAPKDAFSRLRPDGDLIWPLVFGLIFSWVGQVFGQIWGLILGSAMQSMMGGFSELEDVAIFGAASAVQVVIMLVLWPIFFAIGIFIFAGIFHLCLMLVGAVERSELGFEGTLKVVAYCQVASLASVVPVVGGLIGLVAFLVLAVIGFTEVHRTTQGKSIIAVLIPIALCCICGIVVAVFGAAAVAMMAGAAG